MKDVDTDHVLCDEPCSVLFVRKALASALMVPALLLLVVSARVYVVVQHAVGPAGANHLSLACV